MATTLLAAAAKSAMGPSAKKYLRELPQIRTNVSSVDRVVSATLGLGLISCGLGLGRSLIGHLAGGYLLYRAVTGNCPMSQALGVSTSDSTADNSRIAARHGCRVETSIFVNKPPEDVYRFWRDLDNLPRFMAHLVDVDASPDGESHWIARGPFGLQVEWDAEILMDVPNQVISWRSKDGADVDTAGSVHFLPEMDGTQVRVNLKYDPPAGKLGTFIAELVGQSPECQIKADLERFRQLVEGEPQITG